MGDVGRALAAGLFVYAVARVYDLVARGVTGLLVDGSRESLYFWLEFCLGALLPLGLLTRASVRRNGTALYAAALMVVLGFVTNRLNVSLTGFERTAGGTYVPAWTELVVTVLLVALGFAAFGLEPRAGRHEVVRAHLRRP